MVEAELREQIKNCKVALLSGYTPGLGYYMVAVDQRLYLQGDGTWADKPYSFSSNVEMNRVFDDFLQWTQEEQEKIAMEQYARGEYQTTEQILEELKNGQR